MLKPSYVFTSTDDNINTHKVCLVSAFEREREKEWDSKYRSEVRAGTGTEPKRTGSGTETFKILKTGIETKTFILLT